jgi:hypothetical protein
MTAIEVIGRVNEQGQLEFDQPANLPPGEVRIIIEPINVEEDAADEALWEEQFARSQDELEQLGQEAHEEHLAGLTEDFDPDDDEP